MDAAERAMRTEVLLLAVHRAAAHQARRRRRLRSSRGRTRHREPHARVTSSAWTPRRPDGARYEVFLEARVRTT
jgi:hypothetical protein